MLRRPHGPCCDQREPRPRRRSPPPRWLQTITWLLEGEAVHRDSLGTEQRIVPGELNLMTAGHGVAHSEAGTGRYRGLLHGAQLWIAQPSITRDGPAAFEHHVLEARAFGAAQATVRAGPPRISRHSQRGARPRGQRNDPGPPARGDPPSTSASSCSGATWPVPARRSSTRTPSGWLPPIASARSSLSRSEVAPPPWVH